MNTQSIHQDQSSVQPVPSQLSADAEYESAKELHLEAVRREAIAQERVGKLRLAMSEHVSRLDRSSPAAMARELLDNEGGALQLEITRAEEELARVRLAVVAAWRSVESCERSRAQKLSIAQLSIACARAQQIENAARQLIDLIEKDHAEIANFESAHNVEVCCGLRRVISPDMIDWVKAIQRSAIDSANEFDISGRKGMRFWVESIAQKFDRKAGA